MRYALAGAAEAPTDPGAPAVEMCGQLAAVDGAVARPVYRLANLSNGAYLFTGSAEERSFALGLGHWRDEGVAFGAVTQDGLATSSEQTGPSALSGACDPTSDTGAAD